MDIVEEKDALWGIEDATRALKGILMPVQPRIVTRVQAASPNIENMSEVIQRDPVLSAGVLKLANNLSLHRNDPICSILEAVTFLGVDRVAMMINAILLRMAGQSTFNQSTLDDYWETSQDVAIVCGIMARQLNIEMVDEAYCTGLFHHIGMLNIWQKHPDYFSLIKQTHERPLIDVENELFQCDHSAVGYFVAKSIGLTKPICEAIRDHHDPEVFNNPESEQEDTLMLIALLKLAEEIETESSRLLGHDSDEWDSIKGSVFEIVGISEIDYDDLCDVVRSNLGHV